MNTVEEYGRPAWVIGSPIEHTLSPPIHNAAFEKASLDHRYFAMEVETEELPQFLELFRDLDGLGANLTIPLKEAICQQISPRSDAVTELGAANTIYWDGDQLALDNTDVYGFTELIRPWEDQLVEQPVCLLGAGGAARACLYALGKIGVPEIYLCNRTRSRAEQLQREFSDLSVTVVSRSELENGDFPGGIVVNATSLGLDPDDSSPFPADSIRDDMLGIDLIYHHETTFMADFNRLGREAAGGLKMLVCQAARAWERWTGETAPVEIMMDAARDRLRQ